MKKLLLSLLAVAGLSLAASADEATFKCSVLGTTTNSSLTEWKVNDNITFTFAKNGGATAPAYNKAGDIRLYAKNTATLTATNINIEKVVFTISTQGKKRLTDVTVDKGEIAAQASGDATVTWTGNATNIVFTVGDIAKYGTESTKAGQLDFESVTITYSSILSGDQKPAGLKYETTSYNVELGEAFTAPELINPNGLAVTYSSSKPEVATVNATTGAVEIVGVGTTTISAKSEETEEFGAGNAEYTITVVKKYNTVAEFYTVGANNKGLIGFDLIVTYVNGANCYAQTEDGEATLIYGSTSYEVGDIIPAGWEGQYAPFNGLDEIKPVGTMPAASGTTTFVPAEVTSVSKADMNRVVVLKNVKFEAATASGETKTNFNGTVGDVTYTFRNNFADVASVEAGVYNVKLAVSYYVDKNNNETLQLYPIEYTAITETGIDGVIVDENAPVEYYNLQGVRVANPENGLYIRRQGNKATKVLVK